MKPGELLLVILGLVFLFLGAATRMRATCDSGSNNFGSLTSYICVNNTVDCGGDTCETDRCECIDGGGGGYLSYCTSGCAVYPGCNGC